MTTDIQKLPADTLPDLFAVGKVLAQSGMFGVSNDQQGFVVAATCQQEGLSLLKFTQTYHVIEGRPSMRADAMLARLLELGGSYSIIARTPERAAIKAEFGKAAAEFTFAWEDAKEEPFVKDKAGGYKKNWATPRGRMQMLWARVVSDAVRTVCPLANQGSYTPEEIHDLSDRPAIDVTAEPVEKIVPGVNAPAVTVEPAPAVEVVAEVVTPEAAPAAAEIDYTVCPVGGANVVGNPWDWFPADQLALALAHKAMAAEGYQVEIKAAIARKAK